MNQKKVEKLCKLVAKLFSKYHVTPDEASEFIGTLILALKSQQTLQHIKSNVHEEEEHKEIIH